MAQDHSLGNGAYYAPEDYPGFTRRLLVSLIDSVVLLLAGVSLWVPIAIVSWNIDPYFDPSAIFFLFWFATVWVYLVPLKRCRIRTIGYRLLGLMIVTTRGRKPSLMTMAFRMLIWLFGPFNIVLDLIWLGVDTESQTLRDCYVGTYVIRNGAEPIGFAPVHLTRYNAVGLTLAYPRVCRPKAV
ncbi:MAG: RDD family protein [Planctomycetota bacterium]